MLLSVTLQEHESALILAGPVATGAPDLTGTMAQLGESGEQEARARLERALQGTGLRLSGFSDKGLDLLLEFGSPSPDAQLLHFGVQVKTGDSFATLQKGRWRIRNLPAERFRQWARSHLPVLFVWIRPVAPVECYWGLVRSDTKREQFSISKRALIGPVLRYDLTLESARGEQSGNEIEADLLVPPLHMPLRAHAKSYYRQALMGRSALHPIVGPVAFTWRGWRHLTGQGRPQRHIHQSLQFLGLAAKAVLTASKFLGVRRILKVTRGEWTIEVRLLIFEGLTAHFKTRPAARLIFTLREQVRYPAQWMNDVRLSENVRRHVTFESIYETIRQ